VKKRLVAGNWKSNGSMASVKALASALASAGLGNAIDVVACAPFVFLSVVKEALSDSGIRLGAQNLSEFGPGAFTGELHAEMLTDVGCEYVIVGHSERRLLLGENDLQVSRKLARAIDSGLRPLLCVGETLEQRSGGYARAVVIGQLDAVNSQLGPAGVGALTIAYEPIWAIGTGQSATPEQAQEVHGWIRAWLDSAVGDAARGVRLLYGGSVTPSNAASLFACRDIDGALVGGASLNANDFLAICQSAIRAQAQ
jgi:triosephosphate isomerase (TIM)